MSNVKDLKILESDAKTSPEEDARKVLIEAEQQRLKAFNAELQQLLEKHRYALRPEITLGPTGVIKAAVLVVPAQ